MSRGDDPLLTGEEAKQKRTSTSLAGLATAIAAGVFGGVEEFPRPCIF